MHGCVADGNPSIEIGEKLSYPALQLRFVHRSVPSFLVMVSHRLGEVLLPQYRGTTAAYCQNIFGDLECLGVIVRCLPPCYWLGIWSMGT
jgi:hypothetical protein